MLIPTCKCGQAIVFPKGKIKVHCPTKDCGMRWERGSEGYWAIGVLTTIFTPILARQKACSVKSRAERYRNYPKSKTRRNRR